VGRKTPTEAKLKLIIIKAIVHMPTIPLQMEAESRSRIQIPKRKSRRSSPTIVMIILNRSSSKWIKICKKFGL
jgi:hypothetical protein